MTDRYQALRERFGEALKTDEPLARYTVARLGGPADALLTVTSPDALQAAVEIAEQNGIPWLVLGGGANVLFADAGFRGLVIINRAKDYHFEEGGRVLVDSGMNFSTLARQCMRNGLAGLEWAVNVPGTVGGAIVNNAGAHGSDMAQTVCWAEILALEGTPHVEMWAVGRMQYEYRTSALKGAHGAYVVLRATLQLDPGHDPQDLNVRADEFVAHRKRTQPPGASLGSIFKNPPGDYAGRLIEAAGLKGTRVGGVQISPVHANFFVNDDSGSASDYRALIDLAQRTVFDKFGVRLENEIEFLGAWEAEASDLQA